jgi:L,D-transpeptidase YcbB
MRTNRQLPLLLAAALAAAAAQPGRAAADAATESAAVIRAVVAAARLPEMRWPDFPFYQDEMRGLYEPVGYAPVWFADGRPRPQAREAVDALLAASECGLDPADYDAARLDAVLRDRASGAPISPRELGLADAAISLAFFRQLSDRHIGRVNPKNLHVDLDIEHKKLDLAAEVRRALATGRVGALATAVEPRLVQYARVKQALARYRALADHPPEQLPEARKVSPGDAYPGVAALARRLALVGDLDEAGVATATAQPAVYTPDLAAAVRRNQSRHGLDSDGVLGAKTFAALNTPPAARVHQLALALERLRWLPEVESHPLVVVNIPAFRLWAWGPEALAGAPTLAMNVIVGRALDRQTPLFTKEMTHLVFYPFWNVPYSLVRSELVPNLRRDPGYLAAHEMELVHDFSQENPGSTEVTPATIDELLRGALEVRQRPGPHNSLGPVKFVMPNDEDIYLHGTPAVELFERSRRDFSHGCVRVADPEALAALVLDTTPGWDRARIEAAMKGPREQWVKLATPVEVFILYLTAYVDREGEVHFLDDVYGLDRLLDKALAAGEPFAP